MSAFSDWVRRWWPGVIPLAVLWVAAAWTGTGPVEQQLTARTGAVLKESVLDKTQIEVSGRDVRLSADAFSEQGRRAAVDQVASVPGVRLVRDETQLIAEVFPFNWSVERDVVHVTLSGNAPLPAIKARLLEAARNAANGAEVVDQMALARGAPVRFDAAALLLIDQVSKLKEGRLSLAGTKVELTGLAREIGGREAISAALKNLPEGYTVEKNDLRAPPYLFQINKDPVASTLVLSGYVPDNNAHAAIVNAITRKFVGEKVEDKLKASAGAPQGFMAAAMLALKGLSRLSTGTLTIQDRNIKLTGDALYPAASEQIGEELASKLPQGWKQQAELSVKPIAAPVNATICQQLLGGLLGKGTIRFETGKAVIDPDSVGLLDRLVEVVLRCSTSQIEITGHTDSNGDAESNLALSNRRAQSVADYLIKAGVPSERITAIGFGSGRPIAPNDTEEGKAQNRRIEFLVK
ncbi:OmpA/MotB [Afipia carboxidovorans OM5]|uniref:OmpA/MotB domain protein n=1 Tax=Afipia carboxidovorans (strain ATCC 49405 / DSM 1227 / KCTC 32145 / OM5) TaxID=504832 RepID=B6JD55_AFIC5|nr:OmpA family protein [Afipia carboxidovorans]ACI91785.1 OmpA/MotB [Afipia carboxidovorans OM5]AEI04350.1 OmpA/MotB domain protein [Afipia carboxidovorans OM4]AEI07980.1 OmpA/MotB domain protein [Afipia carboxidovorans OM5]BEV45411.1 OmpA family protein [Afipia carboxidovorans]